MPELIPEPVRVTAAGNKPKLIDEYVGRVNSGTAALSIAHMRSPGGWSEPRQRLGNHGLKAIAGEVDEVDLHVELEELGIEREQSHPVLVRARWRRGLDGRAKRAGAA